MGGPWARKRETVAKVRQAVCDLETGLPPPGLCVLWEGWAGFL